MHRTILKKVIRTLVVLLLLSFVAAFMLDLTPGDPAYSIMGTDATPEQIAQVHEDLGLDDPMLTRYGRYLGDLVQGDLGESYISKEAITDAIKQRVPVTAEIAVLTILVSLIVAIPIGVYTAYRAGRRFDRLWTALCSVSVGIPSFVAALILVSILALQLRDFPLHFPVTGWENLSDSVPRNLWYAALPVLTLSMQEIPMYSRLLRADLIATLQEDYILMARAKGLPTKWILFRHALRPSSFSLLTVAGLSVGRILSGAVIIETLFALPGLGQLVVQSIATKDVIMVQGVILFIGICYVLINTLIDVMYKTLDPRMERAA